MPTIRCLLWLAVLLAAAIAVACGGGGASESETPTPPSATATPEPAEGSSPNEDPLARAELPPHLRASRPPLITLPAGYRQEVLVEGLDLPTSLAATPDGRLLIAEQNAGRVRVVQNGVLLDEPWLELDVYFSEAGLIFIQELGLVNIAVDPQFAQNGFVYIYYTEQDPDGARRTVFARLREVDGRGADLTKLVTVELAPGKSHVAGGIAFQGDAILLGIGDHERPDLAPKLDTIAGKILRIDRDGNPLPDNPFVGQEGADPRIYAYGLRNPFGLAVDPASERAFFTDNRTVAGDAVYELVAGADYGWPNEPVALRDPLVIYEEPTGIAGIIVYQGGVLSEFTGDLLYCTFHTPSLHWSEPDPLEGFDIYKRDRIVAIGCATSVTEGVDGFLYFLSYNDGKLLRISR